MKFVRVGRRVVARYSFVYEESARDFSWGFEAMKEMSGSLAIAKEWQ